MIIRPFRPIGLFGVLFLITMLGACKKDTDLNINTIAQVVSAPGTRAQLTLDSLFLYAKETYLWNSALPTYEEFNPRGYVKLPTDLDNMQDELFAITQFRINPSKGVPFEFVSATSGPKYSFISTDDSNPEKKSTVALDGVGDDFGLALTSVAADDIRIRLVNPGSPAYNAGFKRGFRLIKVNGRSVRADSQSDIDFINLAFNQQTMTLTAAKPDLSTIEKSLTKSTYSCNPVLKTAILDAGTKKAGYIVYGRFSSLNNSQPVLDQAFSEFAAAGITDIIVDLRYNGGGYVKSAEYLSNLIIPTSFNGSLMYREYFNELMQNHKAPILSRQVLRDENGKPVIYNGRIATWADKDYSVNANTYYFNKKGSLNTIKNVYFIISGSTASASELVINNLKPYLNVVLIGSKSYGKPVGFFGLKIDKYTIYMSQFQSKNSRDEGDYFDGFQPDFSASDDVTRDFGNPNEICLSQALALIKGGATLTANTKMALKDGTASNASAFKIRNIGLDKDFKGMIETRSTLKR